MVRPQETMVKVHSELADRLQVSNEIVTLVRLLNASEGHFGPLDVLLRVDEVLIKDVVGPCDARLLVSTGVVESIDLTRLATEEPMQSRSGHVLRIL